MTSRIVTVGLPVLGIVLIAGASSAQDSQRNTLKGLPGIGVLVESLDPDLEKDGLTADLLTMDTFSRLRLAGIRFLTTAERRATLADAYVHVNLKTLKNEKGLYAYSIDVAVRQVAVLMNGERAICPTRETGGMGTVGADGVREVRGVVKDKVNEFIDAWLSVNPK